MVKLSQILDKEILLPLKLLNNPSFTLKKHPFNPDSYWLVDEAKSNSNQGTIDSYGIAIFFNIRENKIVKITLS